MKYGYGLVYAALVSLMTAQAKEPGAHLFILSGQSNMAGLNPDLSFTPAVAEAFGQDQVIVVKDAQGGQPIRRWYRQWVPQNETQNKQIGDLYDRLMSRVKPAIQGKDIETVTLVWMQGERDAKEKYGDVYAASLRGLIDQLKDDLGREEICFVIGRLSDHGVEGNLAEHWNKVRQAQVAVAEADPRGAWVDTDDLNDGPGRPGKEKKNGLHYTAEGYKTLGARFAEQAITLLKKRK